MIQIRLRQLEYFVAAAQHGSTALAAQALHISQPSVSKAIAELEQLWGEALFVRQHAKGMALTAAGLERSRQSQALIESALALQRPRTQAFTGVLRLGFLSTLGARWIPYIVAQLHKRYPRIELQLVEGDIDSLTQQVERGQLDAALQYDVGWIRPKVQLMPVASLAPYALLPAQHALASATSVSLAQLANYPLLLIELPHSREYFLSLFRAAGITPTVAHEFASLEMVRSMVANGHGVSVLTTRPSVDRTHDGKRLLCKRIKGKVAMQAVVLVVPQRHASPLVEPVLQVMQAVLQSAVQQR